MRDALSLERDGARGRMRRSAGGGGHPRRVDEVSNGRKLERTTGGTGGDAEAEAARAPPLPRRMMARAATAAPIAMGATFTMFTIAACVPECDRRVRCTTSPIDTAS